MRRLSFAISVVLVTLAANVPASSAATETDIFDFHNQTASASFDSYDGCVETFAYVVGAVQYGGFVAFAQYDSCTGEYLHYASGFASSLTPSEFQVTPFLKSATLNTTIDVLDLVSNSSFPVAIAMSWTGVGATSTNPLVSTVKAPGFVFVYHYVGISRGATATGTVSDGTTDYTPQPSLAPSSGAPTNITSTNQGQIVISHG
jgi:hypothetical protein